jgi:hypothetical protein
MKVFFPFKLIVFKLEIESLNDFILDAPNDCMFSKFLRQLSLLYDSSSNSSISCSLVSMKSSKVEFESFLFIISMFVYTVPEAVLKSRVFWFIFEV